MSMGAVADNGMKIIESVLDPSVPDTYLFTAFGHMLQNHYEEAIGTPSQIHRSPRSRYLRKVGRPNELGSSIGLLGKDQRNRQAPARASKIHGTKKF